MKKLCIHKSGIEHVLPKRELQKLTKKLHRQEQNRVCTAKKRALETHEETLHRQVQDRACTAKERNL